ncbi:MAG: twin-arginine translocase TatA/TatE family subunit [Tissierellia bacterium]|jgi:sec-independent protein translocase protein TatA|nr:twin-arginine translocase TatA/TatE family subunit [Tissierellia bacterium]
MGRIGIMELLVILVIVLVLFGPKKLPELARGMGEAVKEFKKGQEELDKTINQTVTPTEQPTTENAPTINNTATTNDKTEN